MAKGCLVQRLRGFQTGEPLGEIFYRFLFVHTGFTIFTALPSVFINTFLMAQTGEIEVAMVYNAVYYSVVALGMFLSARLICHAGSGVTSLIGILGYNLLYLMLILLGERASDHVVLLGSIQGVGGAFYWMSHSQRLTETTNLQNRDGGLALLNIAVSLANLTIPMLSGVLITAIGGMRGYYFVFILAFVVAVITAIGSIRLPNFKMRSQVNYRESFRLVVRNRPLYITFLGDFCRGLRDGIFGFILNVLLYQLIRNEALIGFNTLLSGAAAIISFAIITRMVTEKNRIKYMTVALGALILFNIFTVFTMNAVVLVLFTIINSLFIGFLTNGSAVMTFDAIQVVPGAMQHRPELFAIKETFLAIGRCLGILSFVMTTRLTGGDLFWQAVCMLALTLTQVGTVLLSRYALRQIQREQTVKVE